PACIVQSFVIFGRFISRLARRPSGMAAIMRVSFTPDGGQVLSSLPCNDNSWKSPMISSADKTVLVCHGAWSGGWSWKKMFPLAEAAGYRLVVPTYTGLGEREHLAHPGIDLETHIQDILSVVKFEDLSDVVLLGHSYGGMVATGVADRIRERVAQLIYL